MKWLDNHFTYQWPQRSTLVTTWVICICLSLCLSCSIAIGHSLYKRPHPSYCSFTAAKQRLASSVPDDANTRHYFLQHESWHCQQQSQKRKPWLSAIVCTWRRPPRPLSGRTSTAPASATLCDHGGLNKVHAKLWFSCPHPKSWTSIDNCLLWQSEALTIVISNYLHSRLSPVLHDRHLILPYHSCLSDETQQENWQAYMAGFCKILVSTSSVGTVCASNICNVLNWCFSRVVMQTLPRMLCK